ncbi:hypothetical protein CGCS363_v014639 [Colletotrichum siamense]|uniref:uncharacterized protein n=1 Tax=Colletotrichum siamense TaxID=690259 RepID=UPI001872CF2F|nr:uncharacterized protein CGCS363_v014639 [Colletotrichum siamense]KAF5484404.1 hypothetical protein CGCS363_v014639 [Colletotrichum siamense]
MCYKVHTHTLSCDVRPIISSTKTHYVNPYETPASCACPLPRSSSSHAGRCPSHGCCSLSSTLHRCRRSCRRPTHYHRYVCDHPPPSSSSSSRRHSYSYSRPPTPIPSHNPWRRLPTFDRDADFQTAESGDFKFAMSELLDIGRILLHAEAELEKGRQRIERERRRHAASHGGACGKVLDAWECGWTRRIALMGAEADDLKLSTEILADCWVKYVGLLRKYERMGQRRVSGILEEPAATEERTSKRPSDRGSEQTTRYRSEDRPRTQGRHRSEVRFASGEYRHGEDRIQVEEERPRRHSRRGSWGGEDRSRDRAWDREKESRHVARDNVVDDRRSRPKTYVVGDRRTYRGPSRDERPRSWWRL